MKTMLTALLATAAAALTISAYAADDGSTTPAPTPGASAALSRDDAKTLKAQSDAQYKARQKVAEANEALGKGDCKAMLDGAAKRACEKSAKHSAKVDKADAKTVHELEEKAIKEGRKPAP